MSLVETMDKDLDRPESAEEGGNQDAVHGKGTYLDISINPEKHMLLC